MQFYNDGSVTESAANTGSSEGVTVSSTVANTKGAWFELIASTDRDLMGFYLHFYQTGFGFSYLTDIGVGGAGNEEVLVPNLLRQSQSADETVTGLYIPISIAKGTRVSARLQSSTASTGTRLGFVGISPGFMSDAPYTMASTYGAVTTDSGGTEVDTSGTINTYGSWVELTASTDRDHRGLLVTLGDQLNTANTTARCAFQLAVGGSGSEEIILHSGSNAISSTEQTSGGHNYWFPIEVPAGSRLAMRRRSSITNVTDRKMDAVITGIT